MGEAAGHCGSSGRRSATMSITLRPNLNFATKADNTSVNWDELKGRLSPFQVDKLTYFFTQFFDHNQDGVIDSKDFAGLNERLRKVAGWELDDPQYLAVCDNNRVFFECLLEQAYAERNTEGFRSMSANGDYELDWSSYKLLFSNFLLGRTIYGPGKYVFGCFDNSDMTEKYKIDYNG